MSTVELILLYLAIILAVMVVRGYLAKKDKLPLFTWKRKSGNTGGSLREKASMRAGSSQAADISAGGGTENASRRSSNTTGAKGTPNAAGTKGGPGAAGAKTDAKTAARTTAASKPRKGEQTNSTRKDLIRTVTAVGTYARKNRYYLYFPGTLKLEDGYEVITAILITRAMIIGINCMGYGGEITAAEGYNDWIQVLNGKRTRFPNPVRRNEKRKASLEKALEQVGLGDYHCEMISVFTSPTVVVHGGAGYHCFTENEMLAWIKEEQNMFEQNIDVKAAAKMLEEVIYREEEKENKEKSRETE